MSEGSQLVLVAALAGLAVLFLPVIHATRSGDKLVQVTTFLAVIFGVVMAFLPGFSSLASGVVVWAAAYIVAALADFTKPQRRLAQQQEVALKEERRRRQHEDVEAEKALWSKHRDDWSAGR